MLRRSNRTSNKNEENSDNPHSHNDDIVSSLPSSPTRNPLQHRGAAPRNNDSASTGAAMKKKKATATNNNNNSTTSNSDDDTAPPLLRLGSRCAVYFAQDKDFFGEENRSSAQGWYPAVIERINNANNTVTARLDDNITEDNLKVSEIRLLYQKEDGSSKWYYNNTNTNNNGEDELFCDTSPTDLYPGDLVMGYFQNGHRCCGAENPHLSWFRGRVARVGTNQEEEGGGGKVCDIAYDDGDYECNIPYGNSSSNKNYITLLQRGKAHPEWLNGLQVEWKKKKKAVIRSVHPNINLQFTNGQTKKINYANALTMVLGNIKDRVQKDRLLEWPVAPPDNDDAKPSSPKRAKKAAATIKQSRGCKKDAMDDDDHAPAAKKAAAPSKRKKAANTASDDDDECVMDMVTTARKTKQASKKKRAPAKLKKADDDDSNSDEDFFDDDKKTAGKIKNKKPAPPAAKKRAPKRGARKAAKSTFVAAVGDVQAVPEPAAYQVVVPSDDDETPTEPQRPLVAMNRSLAHTFGKALLSADCDLGSQLLTHMLAMHHSVPTDELYMTLMDLIAYGPKSGKTTFFPDCYRMDRSMMYLRLLFSLPGQLAKCSELVGNDSYVRTHGGTTYLETFLQQMTTAEYYMADGDEARTNKWAVDRVCQSLQARNCFAEIFLAILKHQLGDFLVAKSSDGDKAHDDDNDDDSYRSKPVVRDIFQARRGAKDAFERAVSACVQHWLLRGHFILLGNEVAIDVDDDSKNAPDRDAVDCLQSQATSLTKKLGTVISYFGALYAKETNENADALADIISSIVTREIQDCEFDNTPLLGESTSREEFLWRFQLRFLMALESPLVPNVKPKLADRLGVAEQYNIIFG